MNEFDYQLSDAVTNWRNFTQNYTKKMNVCKNVKPAPKIVFKYFDSTGAVAFYNDFSIDPDQDFDHFRLKVLSLCDDNSGSVMPDKALYCNEDDGLDAFWDEAAYERVRVTWKLGLS